tara:strand:+ start:62 stop:796 length:735 start_codon:yes stop_codon:yes gene_type:complete
LDHIDLCSGIGGFALGFEWAGLSKPVLFCDIEPWSRKVLKKHWPNVPIASDVKELASDPERLIPQTDPRNTILTAGYPCQPFSVAGNQKGAEDNRHIWPYILEIVAHKRPAWCVFENVYGHIGLGLDQVLFDLEAEGYASRTFIVPACGVDAPQRRDRLWIVAHSDSQRGRLRNAEWQNAEDAGQPSGNQRDNARGMGFWDVEPSVGRVAHGIPKRVDRLRGLGNAIVPQIAQRIGETILQNNQ